MSGATLHQRLAPRNAVDPASFLPSATADCWLGTPYSLIDARVPRSPECERAAPASKHQPDPKRRAPRAVFPRTRNNVHPHASDQIRLPRVRRHSPNGSAAPRSASSARRAADCARRRTDRIARTARVESSALRPHYRLGVLNIVNRAIRRASVVARPRPVFEAASAPRCDSLCTGYVIRPTPHSYANRPYMSVSANIRATTWRNTERASPSLNRTARSRPGPRKHLRHLLDHPSAVVLGVPPKTRGDPIHPAPHHHSSSALAAVVDKCLGIQHCAPQRVGELRPRAEQRENRACSLSS